MNKKLSLFFAFLPFFIVAQLNVSTTLYSPSQLINQVLLGPGVVATNVMYNGHSLAVGYFKGLNTGLGIDSGIIMATGKAIDAIGPNNSGNTSSIFNSGGYSLLDSITGQITKDKSILEFDFVPSSDTVQFRYVFASEEYTEGVCTPYNDVFAFILSGPGIPGGMVNLATVPGSNIPVTISSINGGQIGSPIYQADSSYSWCHLSNTQYFVSNSNGLFIEYDGYTKVLTAKSAVTPCNTYHIILAITDGGNDDTWDSAVFLEAGSFNSKYVTVSQQPIFIGANNNGASVEGCGYADFVFRRYDSLINSRSINFTVTGSATLGTDYTLSANSIYFAPGQDTVHIRVYPTYDLINEGTESIVITLIPDFIVCSGWPDPGFSIDITDQNILSAEITQQIPECNYDSIFIKATINGGGFNNYYNLQWLNPTGISIDSLSFFIPVVAGQQTIQLQVTDSCADQTVFTLIQLKEYDCPPSIPNIFSPNNDGINDIFYIKDLYKYESLEFSLFNRWGNEVYKSKKYNNEFDGENLVSGTYFYVIKDGVKSEYKGFITLVR